MDSPLKTKQVDTAIGTFTVKVYVDDDSSRSSPRQWDNFGYIVAWMRQYSLSDNNQPFFDAVDRNGTTSRDREAFEDWSRDREVVRYPLFICDTQGGADINVIGDERESRFGYVYCTLKEYCKEFNVKLEHDVALVEATTKQAYARFKSEIEDAYVPWLQGEVYGFVVKGPDGETVNSCWGFIGGGEIDGKKISAEEYCMSEGVDFVHGHVQHFQRVEQEATRYMVI